MISIRKIAMLAVTLLVACGAPGQDDATVPGRWYTQTQVASGQAIYADNCAVCHGDDGSATADWRIPGADGSYPPPPLNGTAHTWHHSLEQLDNSIANGGIQFGGVMPGFAATLNENQRLSVIAHIQSLWPDAIYSKWEEINERDR